MDIASAPDGRRPFSSGADGRVVWWAAGAQLRCTGPSLGHQGAGWSAVFSLDGAVLATAGGSASR
ncbi:hypothetical protein [Streptomyces sp. NPDC051109]|uniref:hypothetical protein n=1 Tax=Streptomyces sp. NPDC051109 TaxID=3365642 RepID=UPI0037908210